MSKCIHIREVRCYFIKKSWAFLGLGILGIMQPVLCSVEGWLLHTHAFANMGKKEEKYLEVRNKLSSINWLSYVHCFSAAFSKPHRNESPGIKVLGSPKTKGRGYQQLKYPIVVGSRQTGLWHYPWRYSRPSNLSVFWHPSQLPGNVQQCQHWRKASTVCNPSLSCDVTCQSTSPTLTSCFFLPRK